MNDSSIREVDFFKYCPLCAYSGVDENKDPCDECLANGHNDGTSKPVKWEEK